MAAWHSENITRLCAEAAFGYDLPHSIARFQRQEFFAESSSRAREDPDGWVISAESLKQRMPLLNPAHTQRSTDESGHDLRDGVSCRTGSLSRFARRRLAQCHHLSGARQVSAFSRLYFANRRPGRSCLPVQGATARRYPGDRRDELRSAHRPVFREGSLRLL